MKKKTASVKPRPKPEGDANDPVPDSEDEGIMTWLKTSSGMEYLTMFVMLNSVVVFLTMSWPQMKQAWGSVESYFEMIGVGLLRGVFLGGIMMWYSMSVWKTVDQYFRDQFQEYLAKEYEQNAAMKKDVLIDKERLAARKALLAKLDSLEPNEVPEYEDYEGTDYGGERPGTTAGEEGHPAADHHGGYSAEEVFVGGQGPGVKAGEDGPAGGDGGEGLPFEDGGVGECLVEDCGGDHVSTRWRTVFDEDGGDVCRFDGDERPTGAQGSCSLPDDESEGGNM